MNHKRVTDYTGATYGYGQQKVSRRLTVLLLAGLIPLIWGLYSFFFREDSKKILGGWGMTLKTEQDFWAILIGIVILLQWAILKLSPNAYIHRMTLIYTMSTVILIFGIGMLYLQWLAHYRWFPITYKVTPETATFTSPDKIMHFLTSLTLALTLMFFLDREGKKPVFVVYAAFLAIILMVGWEVLSAQQFEILMDPQEILDTPRDLVVNAIGFLAGILIHVTLKRKSYGAATKEYLR